MRCHISQIRTRPTRSQRLPLAALTALLAPALAGCVPGTVFPVVAGVGASVAVFHRTIPDLIYSGITGRDCSLVWVDRGESYCRPVELPVPPQPYCTRSLGTVDCWAHPERIANLPPEVAQGPHALTPEQDRYRLARWPRDLNSGTPAN